MNHAHAIMSLNALYVDFNAYFASVAQQLQPALRGKPATVCCASSPIDCDCRKLHPCAVMHYLQRK